MASSNPELNLLAFLSRRENYEKYKGYVTKDGVLSPEAFTILGDIGAFFTTNPAADSIVWGTFKLWVSISRHSDWKSERLAAYSALYDRIDGLCSAGPLDVSAVDILVKRDAANRIIDVARNVSRGEAEGFSEIIEIVERAERSRVGTTDISGLLGPTDLKSILDKRVRSGGFEWRCRDFNNAIGPLHGGDLVMLFGRPEAGKTSWLCSELTHMVRFLEDDKNAVIFNPEEGGGRVFLRLITACLDEDIISVAADEASAMGKYESTLLRTDRISVVEPAGGISTRDIEKVLDTGKYGLVAINILDKIRMPVTSYSKQEKEVDRFRSLAYWMREAANKYQVPILAVSQADASAEGQRVLTQNMIYGSKTGVQGEADLLLGMGLDPSVYNRRYISILKNKLPGGPTTDPRLKHAILETEFNPSTGRFSDA